jgi:hypothetical protein
MDGGSLQQQYVQNYAVSQLVIARTAYRLTWASELFAEVRPRVRLQGHHALCSLDPGTTVRHIASMFSHRLSRTSRKTTTRRL